MNNKWTKQGRKDFLNMLAKKDRHAAFMSATGTGASYGYVFGLALDVGDNEVN